MLLSVPLFFINYFIAFNYRYHFFLQLKMDVIEGRILCDADQAVLLASYSMQGKNIRQMNKNIKYIKLQLNIKLVSTFFFFFFKAEFGDHDLEKHTSEYLKDFALFPKVLYTLKCYYNIMFLYKSNNFIK